MFEYAIYRIKIENRLSGLKTAKKGVITLIFDVMEKDLNKLALEAHANAVKKGFWDNNPSNEHFLCLVICELSEAVEADRAGKRAKVDMYKQLTKESIERTGNPHYFNEVSFSHEIKYSVEDELADAFIRLLDLAGANNYNLNRFCLQHVVTARKTFTENIYAIIKDIMNYKYSKEEQVNYAMHQIRRLSEILKIDLFWHIEQKMAYNKHREYKHGKGY